MIVLQPLCDHLAICRRVVADLSPTISGPFGYTEVVAAVPKPSPWPKWSPTSHLQDPAPVTGHRDFYFQVARRSQRGRMEVAKRSQRGRNEVTKRSQGGREGSRERGRKEVGDLWSQGNRKRTLALVALGYWKEYRVLTVCTCSDIIVLFR